MTEEFLNVGGLEPVVVAPVVEEKTPIIEEKKEEVVVEPKEEVKPYDEEFPSQHAPQ